MTLIRHRQGVIHAITPNADNRRWLKGAHYPLPDPVYPTLAAVGAVPALVFTVGQSLKGVDIRSRFTGGAPPVWYSTTALPPGLALDASTGRLTGTFTTAGSYSGTFTAHDATGATATQAWTSEVMDPADAATSAFTLAFDQQAYE
jgi:hypothetical protein